jgi:tetratricopeptide (TPR) repeat protein
LKGLAVACCLLCVSGSVVATAQEAESSSARRLRADELVREGTSHFRLNEFEAALKAYIEAYRLSQSPELLYDIAQCHRKLNHKQDAIDSFKSFLQESKDQAQKAEVERIIEKLEAAIREENAAKNAPPQGPITPPASSPPTASSPAAMPPSAKPPTAPAPAPTRSVTAAAPPPMAQSAPPPTPTATPLARAYSSGTSPSSAVVQTASVTTDRQAEARPVYKRWWFWTAVGGAAIVAVGIGLGVGLAPASTPSGTLGPAVQLR